VKGAARRVEARIDEGKLRHEVEALAALSELAPTVVEGVRSGVEPPPTLPWPEAAARSLAHQVLAELSGGEGARKAVRASAARWMAAGEVALRDWRGAEEQRSRSLRRSALARALDLVQAELERDRAAGGAP
jgi:hypothetical protein